MCIFVHLGAFSCCHFFEISNISKPQTNIWNCDKKAIDNFQVHVSFIEHFKMVILDICWSLIYLWAHVYVMFFWWVTIIISLLFLFLCQNFYGQIMTLIVQCLLCVVRLVSFQFTFLIFTVQIPYFIYLCIYVFG